MHGWKIFGVFLCFNFALIIVTGSLGWAIGLGNESLYDVSAWVGAAIILTTAGGIVGGIVGVVIPGVNPLMSAAVGMFTGLISSAFIPSYRVLLSLALSLDGGEAGIASIATMGYLGFCTIGLTAFLIQIITGGWKGHE